MLETVGEVRGRKKLQKMVFIAQNLGYPFGEPFELHVWGPYSEVLATKLKEMTDWGFAAEEELPGPAGNHLYVYRPGPNAARASGGSSEDRLADLVTYLNSQDATLLEGAATLMYLKAKGADPAAAAEMLGRLKPDKYADPARVQAAQAFVHTLDTYRTDG